MPLPLGPEVDTTPRPLPTRVPLRGRYVVLEPLHRRHAAELFQAAQGGDDDWTYLSTGPFASVDAMAQTVMAQSVMQDRLFWAIRPLTTGVASGWIALTNIEPWHAAIEVSYVWFSPRLQRTRAATEAIYLLMKLAADDLGYRRLVWKCNALNAASKRAAERLGFSFEGRHRQHIVIKGRLRDTDWFSIVGDEWPRARGALIAWLDPANFDSGGTALHGLADLRERLT